MRNTLFIICLAIILKCSSLDVFGYNILTNNSLEIIELDTSDSLNDSEAEKVHRVVETFPEFPGGQSELIRFLQNNIQYPDEAMENEIEGVVYLEFVIGVDGYVSSVKIIRDPGYGLGQEAERVVRKMPKWKPGRQGNKNVAVYYNLPINFRLQ